MPTSRGFNTTAEQRNLWSAYRCNTAKYSLVRLPAGPAIPGTHISVPVATPTLGAWELFSLLMSGHDVTFDERAGGTYNCRVITGGSGYSLHAYGIALDLNPSRNPYGTRLITDMPKGFIDAVLSLRTNNNRRVFSWGGDWDDDPRTGHNPYDAMHFQIACGPSDLSTGIESTTIPTLPSQPGGGSDNMLPFEQGQSSTDIAWMQTMLATISPKIVIPDGNYGPATANALRVVLKRTAPVTRVFAGDFHALMDQYVAALQKNNVDAAIALEVANGINSHVKSHPHSTPDGTGHSMAEIVNEVMRATEVRGQIVRK